MPTVLVLEDEPFSAMALNALLEDEGFVVKWFTNTDDATAYLAGESPDIIVADWQMSGACSSAEIARRARSQSSGVKLFFVTGYAPEDIEGEIHDLKPYRHFPKPLDYDQFLAAVKG